MGFVNAILSFPKDLVIAAVISLSLPQTPLTPHTCGLKKSSRTKSFDRRRKDREVRRFDLARKLHKA